MAGLPSEFHAFPQKNDVSINDPASNNATFEPCPSSSAIPQEPKSPASAGLNGNQDLLRASFKNIRPEIVRRAMHCLQTGASLPPPISVHYDLTQRCNGHCGHCQQWTWPERPDLPVAEVDRLFAVWQRWGVRTLTLGGGNPLLHKELCQVLFCAKQRGFAVGLISEGTILSGDQLDGLVQTASWIRFSLDGPDPESHDVLRNSSGLFAAVVHTIGELRRRSPKLTIGLNCVIQKRNIGLLPKMVDLACRLEVNALLFKLPHGMDPLMRYLPSRGELVRFADWASGVPRTRGGLTINAQEIAVIIKETLAMGDLTAGCPVNSFHLRNQVRCYTPLFFLASDAEGNMYPCDYLQADTRSLTPRYQTLRSTFRLGNAIHDGDAILARRDDLLRSIIHRLPTEPGSECGCCTRFFQFNAALTEYCRDMGTPAGGTDDEAPCSPLPEAFL